MRVCDSCSGALAPPSSQAQFFVVRLEISSATAKRPDAPAAPGIPTRITEAAKELQEEHYGDLIPGLVTHADLRVCAACVIDRRVKIDLGDLIRAAEAHKGRPDVSTP